MQKRSSLQFPVGGMNRRAGYQAQPPYTTPDCLNVWPWDSTERRQRGGSRPGLTKAFSSQIGGGSYPIRALDIAHIIDANGNKVWIDNFDGSTPSSSWTTPATKAWQFANVNALATTRYDGSAILRDGNLTQSTSSFTGSSADIYYAHRMHNAAVPDPSKPYVVTIRTSGSNSWAGQSGFGVYLGVAADLSSAAFKFMVQRKSGSDVGYATAATGAITSAWTQGNDAQCTMVFAVKPNGVNFDVTYSIAWDDGTVTGPTTVSAVAFAGHWWGVVLSGSSTYSASIDWVQLNYVDGIASSGGDVLVASANGAVWRKPPSSTQPEVCSTVGTCSLASDRMIRSASRANKVYFADRSTPYISARAGTLKSAGSGATANVEMALSSTEATYINANKADLVAVLTGFPSLSETFLGTYAIDSAVDGTPGKIVVKYNSSFLPSGDLSCNVTIGRGPKYYDATADQTFPWLADTNGSSSVFKGVIPTECPLVARYRNRMVLAGAPGAPHVWYMSRAGSPNDWEVGSLTSPSTAAVAGTTTEAGTIAEPLSALVPFSDDYLLFATRNSLWIMRGDPGSGGVIDSVDRQVGIVGPTAWCFGSANEVYFLSDDGVYVLPPGASGRAESLSKTSLPEELIGANYDQYDISMCWDNVWGGVHLFLAPIDGTRGDHWFLDIASRSMWPVRLDDDVMQATSMIVWPGLVDGESRVLLAGRDGYLRRYLGTVANDEGSEFSSYVTIGPFALGDGQFTEGMLTEVTPFLDEQSGALNWYVFIGRTAEEATQRAIQYRSGIGSPSYSGYGWDATKDMISTAYPRTRGTYACIQIEAQGGAPWCIESIAIARQGVGRRRV